jgi:hypothetical protein
MCWLVDAKSGIPHLAFELDGQQVWEIHWDLENMVLSMVIDDVFVVVESLVRNQCKGKSCNFLPFNLLSPNFFPIFFICFFHLHVGRKFMVLFVLIVVRKALVRNLEIRFPAHGVMNVFRIMYPQFWVQPECDATFVKHPQVIKLVFFLGKTHNVDDQNMMVGELLNVVTMIANKTYSSSQ